MASENILPDEGSSSSPSLIDNFHNKQVPPVFKEMNGQILDYDLTVGTLTCQFPVEERYQNPYRTMQGGMIAAAIDNTIGPLSVLIAPPNVTRQLEIRYKRPITADHHSITITAVLKTRTHSYLFFNAQVRTDNGELAATAKARHYILPVK
jgi:acyl-coenzyme A thioesterase PaaI-like protein